MTGTTQQDQSLPYLLKAVILMWALTLLAAVFLLGAPHLSAGRGAESQPRQDAVAPADDGVTEGKVSPFGPRVR